MWLLSVPAAVALLGALGGAVAARALTELSPPIDLLVGAAAGWVLASVLLGGAAERIDRRLHVMGGTRRRSRRRDDR